MTLDSGHIQRGCWGYIAGAWLGFLLQDLWSPEQTEKGLEQVVPALTLVSRTLRKSWMSSFSFLFIFLLFLIYFLLVRGYLLYNIVVVFVIHWHESAMDLHVFPIPIPPPTSLSTRSLWVFPVHQAQALVSCIQPGLVICFTLDNMHVLMLFSERHFKGENSLELFTDL